MGRKARGKSKVLPREPLTGGVPETLLLAGAVLTVLLVTLYFSRSVNRVFDVPKALALKVGGAGSLLAWLLYGLFGRGYPLRSIRVLFGPILALTLVVALSTLLSVDVPTSFYGVYERQFGLQGFLGCIGLFVIPATCLGSRRGALLALFGLVALAGVVGSYAFVQAHGHDPFLFFTKPHTKVYSTLGNATFAGNALALVFPLSLAIAAVTTAETLIPGPEGKGPRLALPWLLGIAVLLSLQILPSFLVVDSQSLASATASAAHGAKWQIVYRVGAGASLLLFVLAGLMGTRGPATMRFRSLLARQWADAFGAGCLTGMWIAITLGLVYTRTRGAWVGSLVAVAAGVALFPQLFKERPALRTGLRRVAWGGLLACSVALIWFAAAGDHVFARSLRSIPQAFLSNKNQGKGQGTRRYLWSESPRVLVHHKKTLQRQREDQEDIARHADENLFGTLGLSAPNPRSVQGAPAWRSLAVYFLGIGVETYRYVFMSHKSKRLEELDKMTNHDNPHNNYLYVLASFGILGLCAYLWLLGLALWAAYRVFDPKLEPETGPKAHIRVRAIALGVVTSLFGYAVYSIAGFDSVACSVFFFFLLGVVVVYFEPPKDARPRRLGEAAWAFVSKGQPQSQTGLSLAVAVVGFVLLGYTMLGGYWVYQAELAYASSHHYRAYAQAEMNQGKADSAHRYMDLEVEQIQRAIRIHPYESFYKQNLGNAYARRARLYVNEAAALAKGPDKRRVQVKLQKAEQSARQAESVLYAALEHAWAPENTFISLFQLYYALSQSDKAEHALERALDHSPHLGVVRANLATLKLDRGAYKEALSDCHWVLEVDKKNAMAFRTCGQAYARLGQRDKAEHYLKKALAYAPSDKLAKQYMQALLVTHSTGPKTSSSTKAP